MNPATIVLEQSPMRELATRWRSIAPEELEAVAGDLAHDDRLQLMPPIQAAVELLRPITLPGH